MTLFLSRPTKSPEDVSLEKSAYWMSCECSLVGFVGGCAKHVELDDRCLRCQ